MNNKKTLIIKILMVLKKYSDENHPLLLKEIENYLESEFNESFCRQSIKSNLRMLMESGIEIAKIKSKYYFNHREFQSEEIELLCHSVLASNTIPYKYSEELIKTLINTQSIYFSDNKNLTFNYFNAEKRDNKEIFLTINKISEAIDKGKYLEFEYQKYNYKKELLSNDKTYKVIPLRTVSMQSRFYLITYNEKHQDYVHYRIDKMTNVNVGALHKEVFTLDPYEYTRHRLYMHAGELIDFEIEFDNYVIDEIIDLFGTTTDIKIIGENKYYARLKTTRTAIKYFAYQYLEHVTVIKPKDIASNIKDNLEKALDNYRKNG